MRTFRQQLAIMFMLLLAGAGMSAFAQVHEQGEVKAAYIYNFSHFVRWPESAFTNKTEPFIVAVLGEDPFGEELEKALKDQLVKGRSFAIVRIPTGEPPPRCHILFIGNSEKSRLDAILKETKGKPILTVSEINPFAQAGGMIRFSKERKKVGLVINPNSAREAGLRITSELLSIATVRR